MSIRPLGDHILLARLDSEQATKGGIVIPDTAKETSQQAKVVAVGKGKMSEQGVRLPVEVKKGDRVLVRRYAGTEIEIQGKKYLVVTESDILGTFS
jgi:chaperonin GroES